MFGAYEFVFNDIISSRYNLVLLYSDADTGITTSTGTPEKKYVTISNHRSGRKEIIGVTVDEPLSFDIEILVDNFDENHEIIPLKRNLVGQIRSWLFNKPDYGILKILQDGLQGYYFKVVFNNVEDINKDGDIIGFKAKVVCDNTGCYKKQMIEFECDGETTVNLYNETTSMFVTQPKWTIESYEGEHTFKLAIDDYSMEVEFVDNDTVTINCQDLSVESKDDLVNYYATKRFNMKFLELKAGMNKVKASGHGKVKVEWESVVDVGG